MKAIFCSVLGAIGSAVAYAFGGWNASIVTLLVFMIADYVTGLIVAGVFHKSAKSETGALESRAGWKGLCKKFVTLLLVIVANRLDVQLGSTFIRDLVCITFITNELLSLIENVGLMGIPIPSAITKAIAVLKSKTEEKDEDEHTSK